MNIELISALSVAIVAIITAFTTMLITLKKTGDVSRQQTDVIRGQAEAKEMISTVKHQTNSELSALREDLREARDMIMAMSKMAAMLEKEKAVTEEKQRGEAEARQVAQIPREPPPSHGPSEPGT